MFCGCVNNGQRHYFSLRFFHAQTHKSEICKLASVCVCVHFSCVCVGICLLVRVQYSVYNAKQLSVNHDMHSLCFCFDVACPVSQCAQIYGINTHSAFWFCWLIEQAQTLEISLAFFACRHFLLCFFSLSLLHILCPFYRPLSKL